MRNAEEFPDHTSDFTQVMPTLRKPGSGAGPRAGTGRIRYAHSGLASRVEPFCTVPQGEYGQHRVDGEAGGFGEPAGEAWSARFPVANVTSQRNDLWVLVCGGIAAAAAFAAAFVASGGLASHPATPASVPAVVSQACPSPAP
jgi:hypothetical protein